jgi:Na+-transporting methylmalonyl-CoA/oxaloacetate decarboxylase gamma subunit
MWENFMLSLEIMAKGMGSIFAVILLLTLIVMILAKITKEKKDAQE